MKVRSTMPLVDHIVTSLVLAARKQILREVKFPGRLEKIGPIPRPCTGRGYQYFVLPEMHYFIKTYPSMCTKPHPAEYLDVIASQILWEAKRIIS